MLASDVNTLLHVVSQHDRRHLRRKLIMPIVHVRLILDEVTGPNCLAYVVLIAADASELRVCSDRFPPRLSQQTYHDRMMISSRRAFSQLLEQRQVQVRKLEQLYAGGNFKQPLEQWKQYGSCHRRQHAANITAKRIEQ